MITLKNDSQIEKMRVAGKMLYDVLCELREQIKPGVTTLHLDAMAHKLITKMGAKPTFLGVEGLYSPYPYTLCCSADDVIVHGFPNDKPLEEGQILSVDCGLVYQGWQSDSAFTAGVGQIDDAKRQLIEVTEQCFWHAFKAACVGNRLGDIASAVQTHAEAHGYGVIRDMCGHGIGREMHEDPSVPNFGHAGHGLKLRNGMTIAIEPMIARGDWHGKTDPDGWGYRTVDHSVCSHYEHTIAILDDGPQVLSMPEAEVKKALEREG